MILGSFASGPNVRTDYNQTDSNKADYLIGRENIAPKSHVENKNNPHGVTAEQVGARSNNWLPNPTEIGAAPAMESTSHPGCYYRTVNGETEWVNPPMELGVAYRTTKRYKGKAVYCALVSIGSIAAGAGATVNIEHFGVSEIVFCYIKDKHDFDNVLENAYGFPGGNVAYDVSKSNVFVINNYGSAWSGAITIEYIR